MKKIFLVLMAVAMIATFGTMAQADTIQFNDSNLGWITVGSLDWTPGNAITNDLVSAPNTLNSPSQLYYQASLGNFLNSGGGTINGTGLNTNYEITVLISASETVTAIAPGIVTLGFNPDPSKVNYINLYYDTTPNANPLNGTGYDDGTLLMAGVSTKGGGIFTITGPNLIYEGGLGDDLVPVQFDQFPNLASNNYPGVGTLVGNGSTVAEAQIDPNSIDPALIIPNDGMVLLFELLFNTSQIVPFNQQNPSSAFWDDAANAWITPIQFGPGYAGFSSVNGILACGTGNCDFQFQSDANTAFRYQGVPEPSTLMLVVTGLLGLGGFGLRRRKRS